ncbi:response regulator transcription factor [Microbacterium fluvii]|uniref:Response regulator transcription factor n=1 Tax=Microbacterium fluvii TaxID=415215 RepID=A0ABW2HCD9_9MICO|nr:response regulator transcription factor [Microbacterium fluvii]MCU4671149.1 response regulator transcription factor [Microbacterium fluvii]
MAEPAPARTAVVIDDDPDVRHLLVDILTSAGFTVVDVDNGLDGVAAVEEHDPVLTTIDVNMPGIDGYEATRRIRELSDTYIVIITALTDEADAVLGFGVGADDVVVKPFRARELRARLVAMLRRPRFPRATPSGSIPIIATAPAAAVEAASDPDVLAHNGLTLDRATRAVVVDQRDVVLTRTEFELLATILESGRRVRSKADLVLTLHDETYLDPARVSDADERAIEAHMTNLRRKLGETAAQPRFIETVRGVGYRTVASPAATAAG